VSDIRTPHAIPDLSASEASADSDSEDDADGDGDEKGDSAVGPDGSDWHTVFEWNEEFDLSENDGELFNETARKERVREAERRHQWVTDTHELKQHADGILDGMRTRRFFSDR
jgi:hypothetical protein